MPEPLPLRRRTASPPRTGNYFLDRGRALCCCVAVNSNAPPPSLAARFFAIIDRLCRALEQHAVRDWTATAFVQIIVANLRHRFDRFVALKARFDAGLPPPPPRRISERALAEPVFDFVPRDRGWLKRTTEHDGAAAFGQLRDLLAEPEMAAFIAADPRVGRLLRPLWWMLSPKLGLPDVLRLPPRPPPSRDGEPRASRAARPATPRALPQTPRARLVRLPAARRSGGGPLTRA